MKSQIKLVLSLFMATAFGVSTMARPVDVGGTVAGVPDFTSAAGRSVHAVVHIKVVSTPKGGNSSPWSNDPFQYFFGFGNPFFGGEDQPQMKAQPSVGFGSGVIITTDGYIITNNHVIDGADSVTVTTDDNRDFNAKVIGGDPVSDIALIKVNGKDLPTIPFGDSDKLKVGEWVLAIGNPFNLTSTVTAGIVSYKGRSDISPSASTRNKIESFIQTDAAVNPGNSGGALVNIRGELVGINTSIISETGSYSGYSFAVPVSIAKKVAFDLMKYGAVQRPMLGVSITSIEGVRAEDPEAAKKLKVTEGAYVAGFSASSPAKDAGLKIGDVITSVNGESVYSPGQLQAQINKYNPGDVVALTVDRFGENEKINVKLKNQKGNTDVVRSVSSAGVLGAVFEKLPDATKRKLGISYGIRVVSVKAKGKFEKAGVPVGFVIISANGTRVISVKDLDDVVAKTLKQDDADRGLFIKGMYADGRPDYFAINLSD